MKKIILVTSVPLLIIGVFLGLQYWQSPNESSLPVLRILTHSSFVTSWGPGPDLELMFEQQCQCDLQFYDADDAGLLLEKLKLIGQKQQIDLVLGLDQFLIAQAEDLAWQEIKVMGLVQLDVPLQEDQRKYLPYDWSPLAFVYRDGEVSPPTRLEDLLDSRFINSIALQDPRTSTPGRQFYFWLLASFLAENELNEFVQKLKMNVHSISPSWSAAYGLLQKKQAKLAFSYVTSPIYHVLEENDLTYRTAVFQGGHPYQVEYLAISATCHSCDLAQMFAEFVVTPPAQKVIMEKNFMLPVVAAVKVGTPFADVPIPHLLNIYENTQFLHQQDELLKNWEKMWSN